MKGRFGSMCGVAVSLIVVSLLALGGCGDSDAPADGSNASGGADAGVPASVSGLEKEAADAAMTEIGLHWSKGPDGWTTAQAEGGAVAPIKFLRQVKELSVEDVEAHTLSEADKLNGFEWAGDVSLKTTVGREAGTNGIVFGGEAGANIERHPGRWSQWVDHQPETLRVQKIKGKWRVKDTGTIIAGTIPTPADYAAAGVK